MQFELAALGELAEAGSEAHEVWSCDRDGEPHRRLRGIKDTVFLETKTVGFVLTVNKVYEILALLRREAEEFA